LSDLILYFLVAWILTKWPLRGGLSLPEWQETASWLKKKCHSCPSDKTCRTSMYLATCRPASPAEPAWRTPDGESRFGFIPSYCLDL